MLDVSLRRLKPEKHQKRLLTRKREDMPFLVKAKQPYPNLLLDTTVYMDALQGSLPEEVEIALRAGSLWHVTVTEAELSALGGLLDPANPGTTHVIQEISASIERRPAHRILNPDRDIWREAGVMAGLLARLQGYGQDGRRRALNDALIFLTGAKYGCAVLTRNLSDFDLLMQIDMRGRALFYERR
jgi:predicted nucleic acid-binding protein